jgi:hypothetical protein
MQSGQKDGSNASFFHLSSGHDSKRKPLKKEKEEKRRENKDKAGPTENQPGASPTGDRECSRHAVPQQPQALLPRQRTHGDGVFVSCIISFHYGMHHSRRIIVAHHNHAFISGGPIS